MMYGDGVNPQKTFQIVTQKRTFEFEASSEKEGELWFRALNIIVEMNKAYVSLKDTNPFIFEEEQMKALQTGR